MTPRWNYPTMELLHHMPPNDNYLNFEAIYIEKKGIQLSSASLMRCSLCASFCWAFCITFSLIGRWVVLFFGGGCLFASFVAIIFPILLNLLLAFSFTFLRVYGLKISLFLVNWANWIFNNAFSIINWLIALFTFFFNIFYYFPTFFIYSIIFWPFLGVNNIIMPFLLTLLIKVESWGGRLINS